MVDIGQINAALTAQANRLTFEPSLEARFERDTAADRCKRLVRQNHVGLLIYNLFLFGDWLLVRDIFIESLVLHILVMTPTMFLVNFVVARRPPVWLREGILGFGIVLGVFAIVGLAMLSHSPLRSSHHHSVVLVILFATMVQRIRFRYVTVACAACLVTYILALLTIPELDTSRMLVADAICAGVVLFSLIGCYNLEKELRIGYLLALRDRLHNEELQEISRRDPLTGAGNRRALEALVSRKADSENRIAVLLCDIDHFKAYNDARGHLAGDECLKRVATLIGASVRDEFDSVFRFGGEEFLVILEDVTAEEALEIGEKLRACVEGDAIRHFQDDTLMVTVSVGVALGKPPHMPLLADLTARADRALYAAKRTGRNKVVFDAQEPCFDFDLTPGAGTALAPHDPAIARAA